MSTVSASQVVVRRPPAIDIVSLFESVLRDILKDKGFRPSASEVYLAASGVLEWLSDDREAACLYFSPLVSALEDCFEGVPLEKKAGKEKMWAKFHSTRTSKEFNDFWLAVFRQSRMKEKPSPLFYQHVTDVVFKKLLQLYTPVGPAHTSQSEQFTAPPLNYREENALYYTAGYIIREILEKIEANGEEQAMHTELKLCLVELSDEFEDCESECLPSASDWTELVSRGGLKFVDSPTYQFFVAMEMKIRKQLNKKVAPTVTPGFEDTLVKAVCEDDDVLFQWSVVSAEWNDEAAKKLLAMLVEFWVTVRGFAFTRQWMEGYKQQQKKVLKNQRVSKSSYLGRRRTASGRN